MSGSPGRLPHRPFNRVAFVGAGLMGGSLAMALRRGGLAGRLIAHSPADAQKALDLGIIDEVAPSLEEAALQADLLVLAAPGAVNAALMPQVARALAPDALLTDLSSVKGSVVEGAVRALGTALPRFVPCHPIAGGERSGPEAARADLFDGRVCILSPIPQSSAAATQRLHAMWTAVGARVQCMPPDEHDRVYAHLSHWPHAVSYALAASLIQVDPQAGWAALAGPGLRDMLRIAASSPQLWADILIDNRQQVLSAAEEFGQRLSAIERALNASDREGLARCLEQGAPWLAGIGADRPREHGSR